MNPPPPQVVFSGPWEPIKNVGWISQPLKNVSRTWNFFRRWALVWPPYLMIFFTEYFLCCTPHWYKMFLGKVSQSLDNYFGGQITLECTQLSASFLQNYMCQMMIKASSVCCWHFLFLLRKKNDPKMTQIWTKMMMEYAWLMTEKFGGWKQNCFTIFG